MLNVFRLERIEVVEKLPSGRGIVAAFKKLRDPILLLGNMSLALGNMLLRLFKMAEVHLVITSYLRTV